MHISEYISLICIICCARFLFSTSSQSTTGIRKGLNLTHIWKRGTCPCNWNHTSYDESTLKPKDCSDIYKSGIGKSGVYRIFPLNLPCNIRAYVYCNMDVDCGGWTEIQKRRLPKNCRNFFDRKWSEYMYSFGDPEGDFWLGNELLCRLSSQGNYSLLIQMSDEDGNIRYAKYNKFRIDDFEQSYKLHVSGYSGNAGDSLSYHNGMKFSTKDRDNDFSPQNCAMDFTGGWWFNKCHLCNLNGLYLNGSSQSYGNGIVWSTWKDYYYSLIKTVMMIRPSNYVV